MSAAIVNISNILLGNLNPNFLALNQPKSVAARLNPLTSESPEVPVNAAQNVDAFENALKISVSPQKPAAPPEKLAHETPLPIFNLAAQGELPQVILEKALTNIPQTLAAANPNAAASALSAANPQAAPLNTQTPASPVPPLTQNTPAPEAAPAEVLAKDAAPAEVLAKDAAPAPNEPQIAEPLDGKPNAPDPQPLPPPKTGAAPGPESPASTPAENKSLPEPDPLAGKPDTPETRNPASHLRIRIPLPENIEAASVARSQSQPNQSQTPPAAKIPVTALGVAPAPKHSLSPNVAPQSKLQAPSKPAPNPDNKPTTDPAFEEPVITHIRITSDPKKTQDAQQPKAYPALDSARTQQMLTAAESQRPLDNPLPAQPRPEPPPAAQNIARQLSEHVTATITEGKNEVSVRLNPPELGRVSIKFEQTDDGITARIEVARPQTRLEIEQALPDLVRGLATAGVQFKRLEVNLAQNPDPHQYRHESSADQQNQWSHHHDPQSFTPPHQTRTMHTRWFTDAPASPNFGDSRSQSFGGSSLNTLM